MIRAEAEQCRIAFLACNIDARTKRSVGKVGIGEVALPGVAAGFNVDYVDGHGVVRGFHYPDSERFNREQIVAANLSLTVFCYIDIGGIPHARFLDEEIVPNREIVPVFSRPITSEPSVLRLCAVSWGLERAVWPRLRKELEDRGIRISFY